MYLHIGNGITVRKKNVIGIFDLDSATVSAVTKKYINKNEKDGNILYGDSDLPRTFVLHEENENGNKKYKTDVRCDKVAFLSTKKADEKDGE